MFYFGTNFKMHGTAEQTHKFVRALAPRLSKDQEVQCFVLPPVTSLQGLSEHASYLWLGAQNMHWANEGAYTGEISPGMLRALEVDLVMLGHAERRHDFGETDEIIAKKVKSALRHGLKVLLCVGETLKQRAQEVDQEVVTVQLKIALQGTSRADAARLLVAYEPVWTIGEGGKRRSRKRFRRMCEEFGKRYTPCLGLKVKLYLSSTAAA